MPKRLLVLTALMTIWPTACLAQRTARLTVFVLDSSPGALRSQLQPRSASRIDLRGLGVPDTAVAYTDSGGTALLQMRPGRYDRLVRKMGHDFRHDTISLAAGETRTDSVVLEAIIMCLDYCPLQGKALRDHEALLRRALAARPRWSCDTRSTEIEPTRAHWRDMISDTLFKFNLTPAQRRLQPRLVTERRTCRRIADVLAEKKLLTATTLLVFSVGFLYFVTLPDGESFLFSNKFEFLAAFIV
jgi:hypothetical protein